MNFAKEFVNLKKLFGACCFSSNHCNSTLITRVRKLERKNNGSNGTSQLLFPQLQLTDNDSIAGFAADARIAC